ncbi:MAG: hypothetical protein V4751_11200 [Pseudomonadota bacterium]
MIRLLLRLILLLAVWQSVTAQQTSSEYLVADALLQERWLEVRTDNFHVISQLSERQTERLALELEQWREAAVTLLGLPTTALRDPLTTQVYLFETEQALNAFTDGPESAYFITSPRSAYLAVAESDAAMDLAQHHVAHYLVNNQPVGMPRWYEEGMAHYLSRLSVQSDVAELRELRPEDLDLAITFNDMLGMEALLYDDSALSSPRLIQVANMKAGMFIHFLLHAHELEGFADRRAQLQNYVALLRQGRTERFAFDQSFDGSPNRLAEDYLRYLQASLELGDQARVVETLTSRPELEATEIADDALAMALGELALYGSRHGQAQRLFGALTEAQTSIGRAYSGYAEAVRMAAYNAAESSPIDPTPDLRSYYLRALATQDSDPQLLLDYGQYLDTELADCERTFTAVERQEMEEAMRTAFTMVRSREPESPEVNLSYARLFLLPGQRWQDGEAYQRKAFERLPADTHVMEQAIDYAIAAGRFEEAESYIARLARPLHFWGVFEWVSDLRAKLQTASTGGVFDPCALSAP